MFSNVNTNEVQIWCLTVPYLLMVKEIHCLIWIFKLLGTNLLPSSVIGWSLMSCPWFFYPWRVCYICTPFLSSPCSNCYCNNVKWSKIKQILGWKGVKPIAVPIHKWDFSCYWTSVLMLFEVPCRALYHYWPKLLEHLDQGRVQLKQLRHVYRQECQVFCIYDFLYAFPIIG